MRPALIRDIETRSTVDVDKVGIYIYASHPTTQILTVGYCLDNGPVKIWHPGDKVPAEFQHAIANEDYAICAHNAAFEMAIERHILGPRHGFPVAPVHRNVCTMAMSLALALPGALERVAKVLNLAHNKDAAGRRVMLQLTKPRRAKKAEDPNGIYWYDDIERLKILDAYCKDDVETTREILDSLPELSEDEYQVWLLDQKINNRGIYLDADLLHAAKRIIAKALPSFDAELTKITNGQVTAITQVDRLKSWAQQFYPQLDTLRKDDLVDLLSHDDLPKNVRRALQLREQGAHASIKKFDALLNRREKDGRIRGAFVYHAAGPGRWSSRGAQVHNLKRSLTKDLDTALKAVLTGEFENLRKLYPANPLSVLGDLIRSTIMAAPGNTLVGADFSGIEARVTAWVAGEESKLKMFREFDLGLGPDPYIVAAAMVIGCDPEELDKRYKAGDPEAREQRQIGKACELAFGYQGGVVAYKRFLPGGMLIPEVRDAAIRRDRGGGGAPGGDEPKIGIQLSDAEIDRIKNAWRRAHPNIVSFWADLHRAARRVCSNHELILTLRDRVTFECDDQPMMWITLPSGRKLAYPHARCGNFYKLDGSAVVLEGKKNPWGKIEAAFKDAAAGQWHDVLIYGGLIIENIVQAISRDILAEAMLRVDRAGFDVVAHVHDECVIEVPARSAEKAKKEFAKLMNEVPSWAVGLPIVAKPWIATRYVK